MTTTYRRPLCRVRVELCLDVESWNRALYLLGCKPSTVKPCFADTCLTQTLLYYGQFVLSLGKESPYILFKFNWGALAAEWEKKGELATTSLEFEYLHRKSRCEMWIGGGDISNDIITLGKCFHVSFNDCLYLRLFLLCAEWRKSDSSVDGEPQGNWRQN